MSLALNYETERFRLFLSRDAMLTQHMLSSVFVRPPSVSLSPWELKSPKPLKVSPVSGLEIGPEQLIKQQRSGAQFTKYLRKNPKFIISFSDVYLKFILRFS